MRTFRHVFVFLFVVALWMSSPVSMQAQTSKAAGIKVPVTYYKLNNGLKVVLSPEHSAPLVTVAVYYNIGFRIEPRDRTGFAQQLSELP